MTWFTRRDLREMAGEKSYERGLDYTDDIQGVRELPDGVVATVVGKDSYRVRLRDQDGLVGECSCPYGREGNFCKHCVAVGLHLLAKPTVAAGPRVDVRGHLSRLTTERLVEILWEHAQEDEILYQRLVIEAAGLSGLEGQIELLRTDWLPAGELQLYAGMVLRELRRSVEHEPVKVQPLLRRLVEVLGGASDVDEGDGVLLADVARQAWETYVQACRLAPPDQSEFAAWLVGFQLNGPHWPDIELREVADLLGPAGMRAYRQALETEADRQREHRHLRVVRD